MELTYIEMEEILSRMEEDLFNEASYEIIIGRRSRFCEGKEKVRIKTSYKYGEDYLLTADVLPSQDS